MSLRVIAVLGAAAMVFHVPAMAAVESASAGDAGGLEAVVVTAQRRTESPQDVGIAISVMSGQSLADKSITYINDLQYATPSLQIEPAFGSGLPQFRLRGVGFIDYTSNNTAPVGAISTALPTRCRFRLRGNYSTSIASKCCVVPRALCTDAIPRAVKSISSAIAPPRTPMRDFPSSTVRTMR